jgi:FtsX-like permease family protein
MIAWLGVRLALAGGREALLRLTFTVVGVWVGLALLLLALTGVAAAHGRDDRAIWTDAAYAFGPDSGRLVPPPVESADGALFLATTDYHDGARMTRAYVAALGDDPPVPAGLERLPGPGEVAASPAMRRLLESTPDDQLDDRFPGEVTMTIGTAGLAHENQLVALIGRTPDQLDGVRSVSEVRGFHTRGDGLLRFGPAGIVEILLFFGTVLLLVPVVIVIFMVTRVGWAQREQRLAAIRLVGATRLQAAVMAGAETGLAAAVGTALAWATYEVGRRITASTLVFQGGHFWREDVAISPGSLVLILIGTPVLVMLAPATSLYWARGNPLAISRVGRRRSVPGAWTALPPVAALGGTVVLAALGGTLVADPARGTLGLELSAFLTQLTVIGYVLGFVLAGPWMCLVVSKGIARLSRGVPGLIAARRIAADPYGAFRAVSVIVLAVAVLTFIGSIEGQAEPTNEASVVRPKPGVVLVYTGGVPASQVAPLLSDQAVVVRSTIGPLGLPTSSDVSCVELSRVRYVSCPHSDSSGFDEPGPESDGLVVSDIYIPTDGSPAAENRVRTQAANLVPNAIINTDSDPVDNGGGTFFAGFGTLVTIATVFVLLLATIGLAAGMLGGLIERRRPFALLRATGVRLGELRRVVFLETAATMVFTSAAGLGFGMLLAYAATRQAGMRWNWPDPEVYAYAGGGVLAALLLSTLALPLLSMTTRYDAIRYE